MIVVYEPWAKSTAHYEFNKNLLIIVAEIYKNEKIIYYGDSKQIELLKKEVLNENIEYKAISILNYGYSNKIKIIYNEMKNIKKIFLNKASRYFIFNCLPLTLLLIKLFNKNKNIKINAIFHGLEGLNIKKINMYKLFKYSLNLKFTGKIKYFVLGEKIKFNLVQRFPNLEKNIEFFNHPYTLRKFNKEKNKNEHKIKIGTVGYATEDKGFLDYIKIVKNISKLNMYEFYHIGKIEEKIKVPKEIKTINKNNSVLSNEEYEKGVQSLDYLLYFYPKDSYKLTASGALLDCLKDVKPIIALKNDYFIEVDSKIGGMGYIVENTSEILKVLESEDLNLNLERFQKNILKNRKLFSVDEIKKYLEKKFV